MPQHKPKHIGGKTPDRDDSRRREAGAGAGAPPATPSTVSTPLPVSVSSSPSPHTASTPEDSPHSSPDTHPGLVPNAYPHENIYTHDPIPNKPFPGENLPYMTPRVNNDDIPHEILFEKNPIEGHEMRLLDVYEPEDEAFKQMCRISGVYHNGKIVILNITINATQYVMHFQRRVFLEVISRVDSLDLRHVHTLETVNEKYTQTEAYKMIRLPHAKKLISVNSMASVEGMHTLPELEYIYLDFKAENAYDMFTTKLTENQHLKHIYLYDVNTHEFFEDDDTLDIDDFFMENCRSIHQDLYAKGILKLADKQYTNLAVVDLIGHPTMGAYEFSKFAKTIRAPPESYYITDILYIDADNQEVELNRLVERYNNPAIMKRVIIIANCLNEHMTMDFTHLQDIVSIQFVNCPNMKTPFIFFQNLNTVNIQKITCNRCPNINDIGIHSGDNWEQLTSLEITQSNITHVHEELFHICKKFKKLKKITVSNGRKLKYDPVLHAIANNFNCEVKYTIYDRIGQHGSGHFPLVYPDTIFPIMTTDTIISIPDTPIQYIYNNTYKEAIILDILADTPGSHVRMKSLNTIVDHIHSHYPNTISLSIQGYNIVSFPNIEKLENVKIVRLVKTQCKLHFKFHTNLELIFCYHSPLSIINTSTSDMTELLTQSVINLSHNEEFIPFLVSDSIHYTIDEFGNILSHLNPEDTEIPIQLHNKFGITPVYSNDITISSYVENRNEDEDEDPMLSHKTADELYNFIEYTTQREPFMYLTSLYINEPNIAIPNGILSKYRKLESILFENGVIETPDMLKDITPTYLRLRNILPPLETLPIQHMTTLETLDYTTLHYTPIPMFILDFPKLTKLMYNVMVKSTIRDEQQYAIDVFCRQFKHKYPEAVFKVNYHEKGQHYSMKTFLDALEDIKQFVQTAKMRIPAYDIPRKELVFDDVSQIYPDFMNSLNDNMILMLIHNKYNFKIGNGIGPGAKRIAQETIIREIETRVRHDTIKQLPMPRNVSNEYEGHIPPDQYDELRIKVIRRYHAELLYANFVLGNRYYESGITIKDMIKYVPNFAKKINREFIYYLGMAWFGMYEFHVKQIAKQPEGREILLWMYADSLTSKNDMYRKQFMAEYDSNYGVMYFGLNLIPPFLHSKIQDVEDAEEVSIIRGMIEEYEYTGGIDVPFLASKFDVLFEESMLNVYFACSPDYMITSQDVQILLQNLRFGSDLYYVIKDYFIKHITNYLQDLTPETAAIVKQQFPTHSLFIRNLLAFWSGLSKLDHFHIKSGKKYEIHNTDYRPDAEGSIFFPLTCHYTILIHPENFNTMIHNSDEFMLFLINSFQTGITAAG